MITEKLAISSIVLYDWLLLVNGLMQSSGWLKQ